MSAASIPHAANDPWYAVKLKTARFYFDQLLPETFALEKSVAAGFSDVTDLLSQ